MYRRSSPRRSEPSAKVLLAQVDLLSEPVLALRLSWLIGNTCPGCRLAKLLHEALQFLTAEKKSGVHLVRRLKLLKEEHGFQGCLSGVAPELEQRHCAFIDATAQSVDAKDADADSPRKPAASWTLQQTLDTDENPGVGAEHKSDGQTHLRSSTRPLARILTLTPHHKQFLRTREDLRNRHRTDTNSKA